MVFLGLFVALSAMALSQSASLTPVEGILPHSKSGDYTNQVQGKPYMCRPEIAFVVDTSPSIGRNVADKFVVSLLSNIENELRRLPNAPGDNTQGSNLHLVTFNKDATAISLNSIGASYLKIMRGLQNATKGAPIAGGTCLSCGIEAATSVLLENTVSATSNKYIIIISDGFNNDGQGNNPNSPEKQASIARAAGMQVLTLGVVGKKEAMDIGVLTSLADNTSRFWKATSASESSSNAIDIVDLIAGESCLG